MTPYYQDSHVTIYHGDCREILPSLPKSDLLLIDPPYGLGEKWNGGPKWGLHHGQMGWDAQVDPFVLEAISYGDTAIVWGGNYYPLPPQRGWLIWDKIVRNFTSGHVELAWSNIDQPTRAFNFAHAELASEGKVHPTQKPVRLMTWCIGFVPEAQAIMDCYMGSGTTLRAAKDLGRKAIGIEREERYCEIAAKRMAQEVFALGV